MLKQTVFVCLLALGGVCTSLAFAEGKPSKDGDVAALKKQLGEFRKVLEAQKQAHEVEIRRLNKRIEKLEKSRPPGAPDKPRPAGKDELPAILDELRQDAEARTSRTDWLALPAALQSFNPDISVIGDFVGHYDSREGGHLDDKWLFRELEVGISGSLDPYARADVFLGIHRSHEDEGHEHEEDHCGRLPGEHAHAGRVAEGQ